MVTGIGYKPEPWSLRPVAEALFILIAFIIMALGLSKCSEPRETPALQALLKEQTMSDPDQIGPYEVRTGSDNKLYVDGPGNGLGYSSGTLWPSLRFKDREEAERAARVANIAYHQGKEKARGEIRAALGLNK